MKKILLLIPVSFVILFLFYWPVMAVCKYDLNCDGVVDGTDVSILADNYVNSNCPNCKIAPVSATGETEKYRTGGDGDLQKGVPWPEPRFIDNGDGTTKDRLTDLIWLKKSNCFLGQWQFAMNACNNLSHGQCELSDDSVPGDWRMPNVRELQSLIDYSESHPALPVDHPFTSVPSTLWSSTTYITDHDFAWVVGTNIGDSYGTWKGWSNYVIPVRGDTNGFTLADFAQDYGNIDCITCTAAPVPVTGQKNNYFSGDDGFYQKGVPMPEPRFIDNGDGTVTDQLTGLIWLKDIECFKGGEVWWLAVTACNKLADGQCGLSDGSVPGDWRMPNTKELLSLIDYSKQNPALPDGSPSAWISEGFWSGTTYPFADYFSAWVVGTRNGNIDFTAKENTAPWTWPVRGGYVK